MPRQGGASQQFRSKLSCVVACYLVKMAVHQGHVEGRSVTVLFSYNGCMHVQTAGLVFRRLCTLRHTCARPPNACEYVSAVYGKERNLQTNTR